MQYYYTLATPNNYFFLDNRNSCKHSRITAISENVKKQLPFGISHRTRLVCTEMRVKTFSHFTRYANN